TIRLPLTSVEAPLPAFSLGKLAYFYRKEKDRSVPMRGWRELLEQALGEEQNRLEKVKVLEFLLRTVPGDALAGAGQMWLDGLMSIERAKAFKQMSGSECGFANDYWKECYEKLENDPERVERESATWQILSMFNEAALTPYTNLTGTA